MGNAARLNQSVVYLFQLVCGIICKVVFLVLAHSIYIKSENMVEFIGDVRILFSDAID